MVSCASGPGRKPVPAVGAPDAKTVPASQAETPPAPPPVAAARAAPSPSEESIQPPAPAQETPPAAPDAALTLPAAPQSRQPAVAEEAVSPPSAKPGPVKFPLSNPQPPPSPAKPAAAADRGRQPQPAQVATPQPASKPGAAAGGAAGAAAGGAAPSGTVAPVGAASASGSTDTAQKKPDASAYGRLREIFARVGDDLQVGLDGPGFLFLGFPDRSPDGDGMSFKGKETRDGKTWFTFRALKLGTFDLDFLRQDNTTGSSARETVRVHVVSDADFSAAVAQGPAQGQSPAEAGDPAFADRLSGLGQYEAALAELLKGYRDGNPDLNGRIAQLYLRTGAYDAAAKYFSKNITAPSPYGDSAVIGLVRVAIARKDQADLLSLLRKLLLAKDPGLEETLIAAARFEKERLEIGVGIDLASEYELRYPAGKWRDEADFILAQLLEANSPFRDISRARATYRGILDQHPESVFAPAARDRVEYIDRHFFQVR